MREKPGAAKLTLKATITRKNILLSLAGVLLSLVSYQAKAQPTNSPKPVDPREFDRRIQISKEAIASGNADLYFENVVIPAELLASGIAQLSHQVESMELLGRPFLVLTNCTIKGDLVLDKTKISVPIQLNSVVFEGRLSLIEATVDSSLFFSNGEAQDVDLSRAIIRSLHIGLDNKETYFKGNFKADKAVFIENASFRHVIFAGNASFNEAQFRKGADFELASASNIQFKETVFSSVTGFRFSRFNGSFKGATFEKEAHFNDATFSNLVNFSNARFQGGADFSDVQFRAAQFQSTIFNEATSFNHATFTYSADFTSARFSGETDFEGCTFPSPSTVARPDEYLGAIESGLFLSRARFEKRLRLKFEQLIDRSSWLSFTSPQTKLRNEPQLHPERTWEDLVQVFRISDDPASRNEAEYQRRLENAGFRNPNTKPTLGERFSNAFWGYGLRPGRVFLWILLSYLIFTVIYWRETRSLSARFKGWRGQLDRWLFAADFSWRTAYKLTHGFDNSRTLPFKCLTLVQSLGSKVLVFFFLKSLANTSPLIGELVNKVLP